MPRCSSSPIYPICIWRRGRGSAELAGKRGLGFINWQRKRKYVHRPEVLDAITRRSKGRLARPHRRHRRSHQSFAARRIQPSARLAADARKPRATSLWFPAITTSMCAGSSSRRRRFGATTCAAMMDWIAFRSCGGAATLRSIALSTALPTAPLLATGRLGDRQLSRFAELLDQTRELFRIVLIHHPPVSPLHALSQAAGRCRAIAPGARREGRRAFAAWPRSSPRAGLARRAADEKSLPSACRRLRRALRTAARTPPATISSASMASRPPGAAR